MEVFHTYALQILRCLQLNTKNKAKKEHQQSSLKLYKHNGARVQTEKLNIISSPFVCCEKVKVNHYQTVRRLVNYKIRCTFGSSFPHATHVFYSNIFEIAYANGKFAFMSWKKKTTIYFDIASFEMQLQNACRNATPSGRN